MDYERSKQEREKMNGWKNYATWNVALWINNEEPLYKQMLDYIQTTENPTYKGLIQYLGFESSQTPDHVNYISNALDYKALDAMVVESR